MLRKKTYLWPLYSAIHQFGPRGEGLIGMRRATVPLGVTPRTARYLKARSFVACTGGTKPWSSRLFVQPVGRPSTVNLGSGSARTRQHAPQPGVHSPVTFFISNHY